MRVGTSDFEQTAVLLGQDHPHACGDKAQGSAHQLTGAGSSPCVWGQELSTITQ